MGKKYYYEVAVALDPVWKQAVYTYASAHSLGQGAIVIVPFGVKKRPGYVLRPVSKPEFETKLISIVTNLHLPDTSQRLYKWIQAFYPGSPGVQLQYLLPSLLKTKLDTGEDKPARIKAPKDSLTSSQNKALQAIQQDTSPVVLYGVTGSGKTRLYCELAKPYIEAGQDVLVVYPEISLTSQMQKAMNQYFGRQLVATYHSKQALTARRNTWLRAQSGPQTTGRVFIGPRSALFLPLENIGLIIVDEAHDGAYKQDSGSRYNGLVVAAALANIHKAKIVLGSATPPIQETYQILSKGGKLVEMHDLAMPTKADRAFTIIDMTDKNSRSNKSRLLSKKLIQSIKTSLSKKQQSLIFLNRRGTARMLLCEECGWHAECRNCDMPLIYHHDSFTTKCHVCGLQSRASPSCPDCTSGLTQRRPGTKAIEQELNTLFPGVKIARFDSDNNKADSFTEQYDAVAAGRVDIIIGTQLLTKGLDLPLLDTVGVLQADSALLMPDYTSEERAFQQLVQVSGRVGRGHADSAYVILQTHQPEHKLLNYVVSQDWKGFYEYELSKRKEAGYPPFSYAMRIWTTKPSVAAAEKTTQEIADSLKYVKGLKILGPAPSFYEKRAGKYSWQIILRSPSRKQLTQVAVNLPKDTFYDLDPVSLL